MDQQHISPACPDGFFSSLSSVHWWRPPALRVRALLMVVLREVLRESVAGLAGPAAVQAPFQ
jgi:hypothetical protein